MRDRQLELIHGFSADNLSPEEFAELEDLLTKDPTFRKVFLEYRGLDSALRTACDSGALGTPTIYEVQPKEVAPSQHLWKLAALVLLCFGLWAILQEPKQTTLAPVELSDHGVAVFTRSLDAELEGKAYQEGDTVPPGLIKLKKGYVELEFYSGASLVLEGPAELEVLSRDGGILHHGKLRAQVPEHAKGFKIHSQDVQLVDLGTSFGMSVGHDKGTEVQVFDGKVELFSPGENTVIGKGLELNAGEGRQLNSKAGEAPIEVNAEAYLSGDELAHRANQKSMSGYTSWESDLTLADEREDLIVRYGFVREIKKRRNLSNFSMREEPGLEGSIIGAQWSEGRWPQKQALDFKRPGDRVRIRVDGTYESITLSTWVRIDGFDNHFNSLMLSDGWHRPGAVHWQILKEGEIELAVYLGDKVNNNSRAPFVVKPTDFGRWVHVVTVYDGSEGMVHHYRDGEPIGHVKLKKTVPLKILDAEIGNWTTQDRKGKNIRNFNGRMDDFAIYSKVMSNADVKALYERGRP